MATPPRPAPLADQQPRGTYRSADSYPGITVFRSYTCGGHLYETRELPEYMAGDGRWVKVQMDANLGHPDVCPTNPTLHGAVCPFERRRFRLQASGGPSLG